MGLEQFSQKQRMAILDKAAKIGVKETASVAGVRYTPPFVTGDSSLRHFSSPYKALYTI